VAALSRLDRVIDDVGEMWQEAAEAPSASTDVRLELNQAVRHLRLVRLLLKLKPLDFESGGKEL
jgi:hypothetical protein